MTIGSFSGPVARPPAVPGLKVHTLLGRGGHGEVWAADDLSSGQRVAVKVGAAGQGGGAASPLASEVALLCRIEHPHIVRLRRVVALPDGGSAMVLELAAGGSLGALVARRGALTSGEVSTLLVPLAGALEQVHRRGLVHGDIAPGNVLLAADGKPLLSDLGTAKVLGVATGPDWEHWQTTGFADPAGRAADPRAADVWSLAAVAWFALTGRPPERGPGLIADQEIATRSPALIRLLTECLSAEPVARPEPAELARRAWDAARPVPIRLVPIRPGGGPGTRVEAPSEQQDEFGAGVGVTRPPVPEPVVRTSEPIVTRGGLAGRAGSGLWSGWWTGLRSGLRVVTHPVVIGGLALSGLLVAALVTGMVAVPGDRVPTTRTVLPSAQVRGASEQARMETELSAALGRIGTARATAFRLAMTDPLKVADEAGSPAEQADRGLVRRLRSAGRQLHGVSYTLTEVRLAGAWRAGTSRVTVTALVGTSSHRQVRVSDGATVLIPAQPPARRTLTLVRAGVTDGDWRLRSIA